LLQDVSPVLSDCVESFESRFVGDAHGLKPGDGLGVQRGGDSKIHHRRHTVQQINQQHKYGYCPDDHDQRAPSSTAEDFDLGLVRRK
jgi:hypothetical protein